MISSFSYGSSQVAKNWNNHNHTINTNEVNPNDVMPMK